MRQLYYQPDGYWFGDCFRFATTDNSISSTSAMRASQAPSASHSADAGPDDRLRPLRGSGRGTRTWRRRRAGQFIFAGSIFAAKRRLLCHVHRLQPDHPAQGKPSQVLMLAASTDLLHWHKTPEKLVMPQSGYDPYDWRDPYVFHNDAISVSL
ncbi:MAG: hypothetical protein R2838_06630 [Caldilineaceae bacterium]